MAVLQKHLETNNLHNNIQHGLQTSTCKTIKWKDNTEENLGELEEEGREGGKRDRTIVRGIKDKLWTGKEYLLSIIGKELFKLNSKKTNTCFKRPNHVSIHKPSQKTDKW